MRSNVTGRRPPAGPPESRRQIDGGQGLSQQEVRALRSIERYCIGWDYWEDETVRKYRALGLVRLSGDRIVLTDAGWQVVAAARSSET